MPKRRSPGSRSAAGARASSPPTSPISPRTRGWWMPPLPPSAGSTAWSTTPASRCSSRGDLLDVAPESYDRCLNVNLRGPFFLTQRVARRMVEQAPRPDGPPRSIVSITSVNAEIPSLNRGEYCISKAGASMLTRLFALRLAPHGIGVFEVRPGIIRTPMTAPVAERYEREIARGITPIARWGEPADVGRAVATIASGQLPFSAGQVIYVDGGLSQARF